LDVVISRAGIDEEGVSHHGTARVGSATEIRVYCIARAILHRQDIPAIADIATANIISGEGRVDGLPSPRDAKLHAWATVAHDCIVVDLRIRRHVAATKATDDDSP
jgi:hypothetical protein